MKALVTGASGFVGHRLARLLTEEGAGVVAVVGPVQNELEARRIEDLERHEIRIIKSDLRRDPPLAETPDPEDWDTLFHLAAYVRTEENSPDVRINDLGTARLLRQLPVENKRVVYTSTIAVGDNAPDGKVTAETPCDPRTTYGTTKLAAEELVRTECHRRDAAHTIVRLPTIYGAGYRPGGMFDVLPRRLAAKDPLARVTWPGRLALLAVEDAATLLFRAAACEATEGRTFVASSNENPATWEIAEAIAAATAAPYRPLRLPKLGVRAGRAVLGPWWQASALPHWIQISAWRANLLLNGLYCDGGELLELLGLTPQDWRQGFHRMYAEDSR